MNVLHLKYALEIAKTGSINKAAENLYMAQPNLSRSIKELESSLGITVFERTPKGMIPTKEGEKLLLYAARIVGDLDKLEETFKENAKDKQSFSLCAPRASYVCRAFSRFLGRLDQSKRIEAFYKETDAKRTISKVTQGDCDLGILRYPATCDKYVKAMLEEKNLHFELVAEFRSLLLVRKDNPLCNLAEITPDDLSRQVEVAHSDIFEPLLPRADKDLDKLKESLRKPKKRVYVFDRASQFELLSGSSETFMWVSAVPGDLLGRFDLCLLKADALASDFRDVLIYRKDYTLSSLDKSFITELCEAKREFL